MKNKGIKQFYSLVIVFAMLFTMMMPIGVLYAATPATSIAVNSAENSVVVGSTLTMSAVVQPGTADQSVTWSVGSLGGGASINATGVLTGTGVGTVIVIATAKDGSGVTGNKTITVTAAPVLVSSITVTGAGGASSVVQLGTLQMSAAVLPANAADKAVNWSVVPGTGSATINATGLLTGVGVGTVIVIATAHDGSGIAGTKTITVTAPVLVMGITVTGAGNASTVLVNSTLAMSAAILPTNATKQSVTWSVASLGGGASINATGVLTGTGVGDVLVKALATDGSGSTGTLLITVTNPIAVTGITVTGAGNVSTVVNGSTLAMAATVLPANATNQSVTWSVATLAGGTATIVPTTGVLTGTGVGTVTVTATSVSTGSVKGTKVITVTAAPIAVTGITVTGAGNVSTVVNGSTLTMTAAVLPANATDPSVTWSVATLAGGTATIIPATGVLTGTGVGTVTVTATANDGSLITGTKTITVTAGTSIAVTGITVTSAGNASYVVSGSTLAMSAAVLPLNATDPSVTWSVAPLAGGTATIDATTGVLTGTGVGTVRVTATSVSTGSVTGTKVITVVVNVPFTITAPVSPTITTICTPSPMTIIDYGTGTGPFTWNWTDITLQDTTSPTAPISIPYSHTPGTGNNMTITPNKILDYGKTYTLTIPAGAVKDSFLNLNEAFTFHPTILPPVGIKTVDLVADVKGVPVNKVITLTTDVLCTLDPAHPITLTGNSDCEITVYQNENDIIVVPSKMLSGGTTYTLTVPAGALVTSSQVSALSFSLLGDIAGQTYGSSNIKFTTDYNLNDLINNSYNPITINTLMATYSPRGLDVHVPKRYLTKFDIAYSTNSTNPLTNVDITAEAEVAKINVQFGTGGPIYQAVKVTTGWNTGYEGSLTTLDDKGQAIGQDIIFEAFDKYGRSLEKKRYIKLNVKGNKLDLSSTKALTVPKTFAELILNSGKFLTDILKQYTLDELTLSVASES